jgi:hypothetical protein
LAKLERIEHHQSIIVMATECTFSDRDIALILKSLPDDLDARRLKLFPNILIEWAETDLKNYLDTLTTKQRNDRVKRMKAITSSATKLIKALDAIADHDDEFCIMREIIATAGLRLSATQLVMSQNQFEEMRHYLRKLSAASVAAEQLWRQSRGQPRNNAASLVLMDIAAIYEWLTGRKASRQVIRGYRADTGPFWKFAAAIWPPVFGSGREGLSAAIKNWASARKKRLKGTRSPLLANVALRHPEWGIFES